MKTRMNQIHTFWHEFRYNTVKKIVPKNDNKVLRVELICFDFSWSMISVKTNTLRNKGNISSKFAVFRTNFVHYTDRTTVAAALLFAYVPPTAAFIMLLECLKWLEFIEVKMQYAFSILYILVYALCCSPATARHSVYWFSKLYDDVLYTTKFWNRTNCLEFARNEILQT